MTEYLLPPNAKLSELQYATDNGTVTPLTDGYCRVVLNEGIPATENMVLIDATTVVPEGLGTFI